MIRRKSRKTITVVPARLTYRAASYITTSIFARNIDTCERHSHAAGSLGKGFHDDANHFSNEFNSADCDGCSRSGPRGAARASPVAAGRGPDRHYGVLGFAGN